ncbi:ankyrin repeat domain-containing protein [Paracoccus onubensis]|uniref:Uncharacterized protein n=1 Tax=Paracoccus onubensis TaxID=1675788 RepID=A0A418SLY7_9RHOB|nr:hypothetical protein [Paracoccus onubensis]RJE81968.1 hypothetical protein D3P04_22200 [Paracoccus onubensis]
MLGKLLSALFGTGLKPTETGDELTRFFKAVSTGPVSAVKEFLIRDPGLATRQGRWGFSAIHMLDYVDFTKKIDLLIARGADINARNDKGHTLAHCLSDPEFLPDLIRHGANLNARDKEGCTPLMTFLVEPHSREMIEALLKADADPSSVDDHGRSVMDYAQDYDRFEEDGIAGLIRQSLARQGK